MIKKKLNSFKIGDLVKLSPELVNNNLNLSFKKYKNKVYKIVQKSQSKDAFYLDYSFGGDAPRGIHYSFLIRIKKSQIDLDKKINYKFLNDK